MELVNEKETGVAKTGLEPEKNVPKKYEVTPKKTNETKEMGDKENNNKDIETLKKVVEDLTGKPGTEGGDETPNEPSDIYPSAPKKAKFRKSTMEQQELKDTVYMRPPPKKRTKEIREMMKNEEDGKLRGKESFESSKTSADGELDKKEVEKENATKKVKKSKRKRPKVKNDIVMAKVYEIEKLAATVDAVKIYRCAFCSVEFKFAKRAVTHLIGTHDIDLDDTPDYVSVEKKSKNIKDLQECDICGFRPKESGTYYIHYHKYFRHQIPLPKGWHAYKCDLCQKEFFTKFQLREHKLIHFEDNPFVCEQCGSGFRSRTCLNSHVFHKHSSIRKHKCPDCPKTFKTATQMKVHQRVHTGEKPFLCPVELCNYRSTTRGNMKLHLNSKHKLTQAAVKSLMEALEASDVNADPLIFEESLESEANKQTLPTEAATEAGPFDILVQTATLENNNDVTDNHNQYMTSQMEVMTQDNVMVSTYNPSASGSNPILLNARDYSLVTQAAVQNQDLDMVIPEDNQMMENQNIPRHVEMLIQDAHQFMQHQENPNQGQYVQDYQANTENEIQNLRSRLPEQPSLSQTYETPSGTISSRFSDNPQGHMTHKILDPHSKEARMMIREAFEGHGSRSLLKSAILHGNQENQRLEIGARHLPDNSNISESNSNLLNEAEKLVIDLHESGNHSIPLNQEDEVVQRLRSQIQQLRDSTEQYRDSSIPIALFRNEHSVPEILIQNISSQQQNMEPSHFPAYHHATGSPPAYNSSSHGLINLPVSDIETQSSVTMTSVSQNESQGQIHSLQSLQGQGYTPVASQPASSQYGSDGTLYQGYYQEHYDIENY
ncbi:zinc finger and BTB domain-containing protein 24-like [Ruditapes philippinarum]|uniref:zinc finger and BTB domain-containing protein 24-like n=1 Tax=Ruditapes philippinarum TaxID=129788 RepID=UPI00295A73A8|nr:zinc finger and BTB domain-containing protein 24-like [Ruditapes philippinarum]